LDRIIVEDDKKRRGMMKENARNIEAEPSPS
jgi:hypothetical protein